MHANVELELRDQGVVWLDRQHDDQEFIEIASRLGKIVDDTPVRVVPGKRTYLARPDPIPLHTDHPIADLIAWRCAAQDERDGASLLLDGRDVIAALDEETRSALHRLELPAMVRLGEPATPTTILAKEGGGERLFYAPWLEAVDPCAATRTTLVAFRCVLTGLQARARRIRLLPGHILLVDNRRMLHGRGALLRESTRRLRRLWIESRSRAPDASVSPIAKP
jgi:hypothetical protein